MSFLYIAFIIATILLVIATLLPLWAHEGWWIRAFDFPRLQLLVISLFLIFMGGVFLDLSHLLALGLIFVSLLCFIYHAWWIVPYTPLFPKEVASASDRDPRRILRIMIANVLTPNRNAKELLALVRENAPHILVTLESDAWWQSKLDVLEPDFPYTIKCPLDNLYGMHVYSKLPLSDSHTRFLVEPDIPSMHSLVSLPSGDNIRLHFLHPAPPSPTENEESSERDAELVIVAQSVAETDAPVIVTGDLNDVAWSHTTRLFRKISRLLDPRVGRGMFNTYHAGYWFLRWPLDHLFHSRHFTLSDLRLLRDFGSDHFALLTELVFEPGRNDPENGLDGDSDDSDWAESKAEDHNVEKDDVPRPGSGR